MRKTAKYLNQLIFFISFSALLLLQFPALTQSTNYIKKSALGIHLILDDFSSADYIRSNSLSQAIKNGKFANLKYMNVGMSLSYQTGISNHFDFSSSVSGSFPSYSLYDGRSLGQSSLLLETEWSLISKLFSDNHQFDPYVQTGVGLSEYRNLYGLIAHAGVGLQVRLSDEAFLLLGMQYRAGLTQLVNDHFYYSLGVIGSLFRKKKSQKKNQTNQIQKTLVYFGPETSMKDSDGDGIPDSVDLCPLAPGPKQYGGCPDSDGDGIPDNLDKCPNIPGFLKYGGCPVPDTDGDGINDEEDSCKTVPGIAKYHGCPMPDRDGDGVADDEDKCPDLPGLKENQGCPSIKNTVLKKIAYDANNIYFETDSYTLLSKSFNSLTDVIRILKEDKNLKLDIEGHTDIVGTATKNQILSENRANAVMRYLVATGNINPNRLTATGFGLTRPASDNKTAAHRALNRRVEFKIKYF
jgi:OmpA-OmpF porin, OOP family